MPVRRLPIHDFLAASGQQLLLDVRSPAEYVHAHIPGAISLPLFTNEERAVVGTAYKQQSREVAIKLGLDFFGPKMRPMVEQVEKLLAERNADSRQVFIYCWRGGMRSGAVAWLLDLYGFSVHVLNGGYKSFRNHALQSFALPYHLHIVGGYTGSGKTELLHTLQSAGEKVIDLEGIAGHKGSAFGNIGLPPQPSQEQFENLLATALLQIASLHPEEQEMPVTEEAVSIPWSSAGEQLPQATNGHEVTRQNINQRVSTTEKQQPIWVEDESQRIGLVNIPNAFWHTMRRSPVFFIDIPFEERLQHLVEEYGALDRERLASAIERISKRLGPQHAKAALQFLAEGNITECFSILLAYYDKHYGKGLLNRENLDQKLRKISAKEVTPANAYLLTQSAL